MVGVFAVAVLGAVLLYQFVEEPARIWMRRMVKERKFPVADPHAEAGVEPSEAEPSEAETESPEPAHGKLQPIHGPRQVPANAVTARAG
jgi:hypothetical protein